MSNDDKKAGSRLTYKQRGERRAWVEAQLAALRPHAEIIEMGVEKGLASPATLSEDIRVLNEQHLPGSMDRRAVKRGIGHALLFIYRSTLASRTNCKVCGSPVVKPNLGQALNALDRIVRYWRLEGATEEMMGEADVRLAIVHDLERHASRFSPDERERIRQALDGADAGGA